MYLYVGSFGNAGLAGANLNLPHQLRTEQCFEPTMRYRAIDESCCPIFPEQLASTQEQSYFTFSHKVIIFTLTGVVKIRFADCMSKYSSISLSPVTSMQRRPRSENFEDQSLKRSLQSAFMGATTQHNTFNFNLSLALLSYIILKLTVNNFQVRRGCGINKKSDDRQFERNRLSASGRCAQRDAVVAVEHLHIVHMFNK